MRILILSHGRGYILHLVMNNRILLKKQLLHKCFQKKFPAISYYYINLRPQTLVTRLLRTKFEEQFKASMFSRDIEHLFRVKLLFIHIDEGSHQIQNFSMQFVLHHITAV